MKRGLKVDRQVSIFTLAMRFICSNHCPDEKGTESSQREAMTACLNLSVATIAPMKRGLKGATQHTTATAPDIRLVATIAPMKRGLKE